MRYTGIHTQQVRNNTLSIILLCLFPCLVVALAFLFSWLMVFMSYDRQEGRNIWPEVVSFAQICIPWILGGVLLWFVIAYFVNTAIIGKATGSRPLQRRENMRVYNLVENLCMANGMKMPKINIIEDSSLNAFACGINNRTYTISLSRGIIRKLDNEELEGVIAHELSHIRHRDVRLLIVSIVFVGIFAMIASLSFRILGRISRSSRNKGGLVIFILAVLIVALVGYFFSTLMRFTISRKREYLADAAAAEMTHRPKALAGALRKISNDPDIEAVKCDDIAQLFIEHPRKRTMLFSSLRSLFATHPPIEKRIAVLEQF
ncbi:MAG: M48 family metallopeptidase [Bacteroidales bacterium]|jgi:heat shock protein HtpX|nr:M48 family metallopeptidase [Bacteroidales bacterium]